MIRAVIIGFSHMHVNEVALYLSEQPDFELVGAAGVKSNLPEIPPLRYTPEWNLENVKTNYCSNIYDDYRAMLDELKPDIAFILSENCEKPEIVTECAKRGVNVSIEKPIAVNLEEAKRIKAAVDKYGIEAVVNWPVVWREYVHRMKNAIGGGIIGKPIKLRYINGHTGPLGKGAKHRGVSENAEEMTDEQRGKTWWHSLSHGGGVYLDISCYGCLFSKWLLGDGEKAAISYGANPNPHFRNDGAPTAQSNGIASVQCGYGNTAPLQIEFDPHVKADEKGIDTVLNLILTHFKRGGTLININVLDGEKLMEAHKNPDLYPDLVVRVTGFTAYFASLSPEFRQLVVDRFLEGI